MDIPERIYLQIYDEDGDPLEWYTHCEDRIHETDIEYVQI